jgi:succinoglycan biosynthesis transport protein ExoP
VISIPDLPRLWRMMAMAPRHFIEREPLSEFGSAFQRLRALLALGNGRRMPGIVLVTSTVAGEGKTTVAVCLGIASVSSGQKVIIVDCDFIQPSVHQVMGVENRTGLSEVLAGQATLEDSIHQVSPSMSVLPSGNIRQGGIDLLNSERMLRLLRTLQENYDLVIMDSAPVLRLSDPLILGSLAEKTLLVTRRDWTTQNNAAQVASQLQLYGADLAAVIFNRSNDMLASDR